MQGKYSQSIADQFEVVTVKAMEDIEEIRPIWEEMQTNENYPKINADIDRYLSVRKGIPGGFQPCIMLIAENSSPVTMVIARIDKTNFKCKIGRTTLFKPLLRQLSVVYGGVIGKETDAIYKLIIRELMRMLRAGQVDIVNLNHLETDSSLYRFARGMPSLFCRDYFPKVDLHWKMSVPENIDAFYAARSKKHRQHLRQYMKKLENTFPGRVTIINYSRENEVEQAISVISRISANTYQNAYASGVVNDTKTRVLLSTAARKGWFRAHILQVNGQPCAFQIGFGYKRTYFLDQIGYDSGWNRYNVGTVLFIKVLEYLCADPLIDSVDFGYGDTQYKRIYGNEQWEEASVYISAPRSFPIFVNIGHLLTFSITMLVKHMVRKLGFLNLTQRYRRRLMLRKGTKAKGRSKSSSLEKSGANK